MYLCVSVCVCVYGLYMCLYLCVCVYTCMHDPVFIFRCSAHSCVLVYERIILGVVSQVLSSCDQSAQGVLVSNSSALGLQVCLPHWLFFSFLFFSFLHRFWRLSKPSPPFDSFYQFKKKYYKGVHIFCLVIITCTSNIC